MSKSDAELPAPLSASERTKLQGVSLDALCAAWKRPFSRGASAYRGVSKKEDKKKPWCARIKINGKNKHIGYFNLEVEAARAYDKAAFAQDGRYNPFSLHAEAQSQSCTLNGFKWGVLHRTARLNFALENNAKGGAGAAEAGVQTAHRLCTSHHRINAFIIDPLCCCRCGSHDGAPTAGWCCGRRASCCG